MTPKDKKLFALPGQLFFIVLILFVFLLSIDLMVIALAHIGKDSTQSLLSITSNPFVSLFIGLAATAIVQSSSTTTSVIVAMVASGSLELSNAIPMVMGANVGTTITSDLVSLSFLTKKIEFRRALTAATSHDFFNILVVIILFPLQLYSNFLGEVSAFLTNLIVMSPQSAPEPFGLHAIFKNMPVSEWLFESLHSVVLSLILSLALLFLSIRFLSKIIYSLLIGKSRNRFEGFVFSKPYKSFFFGTIVTIALQSSSVTTSLIVPVVATGRIKIKHAFPFILGANIGTTITALLAAMFKNEAAVTIAIVHLVFNLLGVLIFMPVRQIRNIPVRLAMVLGALTMKYRIAGFIFIIVTFFLLPFALIFVSK